MASQRDSAAYGTPLRRTTWTLTILLVAIGLAAVARRTYVLTFPSTAPSPSPASALDSGFASHRDLTLLHILPAFLYLVLAPLQFLAGLRRRRPRWHRWSGRALLFLGAIVGGTALVMSFRMNIGGVSETAATTLYAILFLTFLGLGFRCIRQHRVQEHRSWMIRAFGVTLGVATTRPIIGAFFAARRLSPHEFFGAAFWLGFTTTLLAAEAWIHYTAPGRTVAATSIPLA